MDINFKSPELSDLSGMKSLWKITFNDSDEYIDMVFDNYVEYKNCIVACKDNKIISMLIAIPYAFQFGSLKFRALYLCGLATESTYRGRGIMCDMIHLISEKAEANKYDFLFLIPADNHLRQYYKRLGFYDSGLIESIKFDSLKIINDIPITHLNISFTYDSGQYMSVGDLSLISNLEITKIIESCMTNELRQDCIHISHSFNDWKLILKDKMNSGVYLIANVYDYSEVFFLNPESSTLEVLVGEDSSIERIMNCLFRQYSGGSIRSRGQQNVDDLNIDVILRIEYLKYGMVRFSHDFLRNLNDNSKGCENPIFQKIRDILKKYGKMKFQADEVIFPDEVAKLINFRFMLD